MFDKDVVKICDMNVAKLCEKVMLASDPQGTPYYIAPEVWTNQTYDNKTDIWSLGCLLFELVTGDVPFKSSNMKNFFKKMSIARTEKHVFKPIDEYYSPSLAECIE